MKKLILSLILLFTFAGGVSFRALANELQMVKISIAAKNQQIKSIFSQIEQKSGYAIVYEEGVIDSSKKVDFTISNESVDRVLDKLLATTGNSYTFVNNQIIITRKANEIFEQQQALLKVTGKIIDENNETVIGANIVQKGTSNGQASDLDGNFTIDVPQGATLVITYLGYQTQQIVINKSQTLNLQLAPVQSDLNEIVIIGYGAVKKRDLTGSVSSVKSEEILLAPTGNPMQAVQGRVAGFDITRTSGAAGSKLTMQLRGNRSFDADGAPLFIIDGIPGDYSTINPNDIESIEVLKDGSSAAVYGSAGANGIIIITTKKGQKGKPLINFNSYLGVNGWAEVPKARTNDSYMQLKRDAWAATGQWTSPDNDANMFSSIYEWQAVQNGEWIDWVDLAIRDGFEQNYSLSVANATDATNSYFSLNYNDEKGIYQNDNNKIYSVRTKIDQKINNWVDAGINIQLGYVDNNARKGILSKAMAAVPLGRAFNDDGSINLTPIQGSSKPNIMADEQPGVYKNQTNTTKVFANGYIDIHPFKGFSFRSIIGTTLVSARRGLYRSVNSFDGLNENWSKSKGLIDNSRQYNYNWENIATYNFKINKDHEFTVTGVTSWLHNQSETSNSTGEGIPYDKFTFHNLGSAETQSIASSYSMNKLFGIVGRVNYSYLGRYLLSVSNRWDGASVLSEGNKWDSFPGISAAWRVSDEAFMEKSRDWLYNFKVRLSYGVTGNSNILPFMSSSRLETGYLTLGGDKVPTYLFSQNLSNAQLGWEKSHNTNLGFDLGFINNRISLSLDLYNTYTDGVIYERFIPSTMGGYNASTYYSMRQNICETKNQGLEITLNTVNVTSKDFNWTSTLTFSTFNEKITSLAGGIEEYVTGNNILKVGEPINSFYHYKVLGIWQNEEADEAAIFGKVPGDIKVASRVQRDDNGFFYINKDGNRVTVDKDNKYTTSQDDYQVIGHNTPLWVGGLQNNFTYKDFDFSFFLFARYGQMIKYGTILSYDPTGAANSPQYFNYWTPTNASNDFPAANANKALKDYVGYDALQYVDGSFIKIKNITFGYSVPQSILSKAKISKLRVYTTLTNPFIFTKSHLLKDYDPEQNGDNDYPLTKQFVFGINLTF